MNATIEKKLSDICPVDSEVATKAQERLDSLTKPKGSLGVLEDCAVKYTSARRDIAAEIKKPIILTFAGDHGVAEEGVSAFPQEVTVQMVANFAHKGAAINVLSRHAGADLQVIDMGVKGDCDFSGIVDHKVARGTANFTKGPAMAIEQAEQALLAGIEEAEKAINAGSTLIGTGDMGIANTTPSAALYSEFLNIPPEDVVGRGTGIDDEGLTKKVEAIKKALEINKDSYNSPIETLAALGGFEIAGICGAIIGAVANKVPVVIDGFISGAAAVTAIQFKPEIIDYLYFSHLSAEAGHINAMEALGVCPLLDLNFRLGEGTGAAMSFNIIEAGIKIMNEMATFADAGVAEG